MKINKFNSKASVDYICIHHECIIILITKHVVSEPTNGFIFGIFSYIMSMSIEVIHRFV